MNGDATEERKSREHGAGDKKETRAGGSLRWFSAGVWSSLGKREGSPTYEEDTLSRYFHAKWGFRAQYGDISC